MKTASAQRLIVLLAALILALLPLCGALAEDYTAQTMRLLHYEGEVEILDANGKPRFVMENARFKSGEAMRTGEASTASVSLDATKIVTMDQQSLLEFIKQGNHMLLTLKEGTLLLDVQKKLDENESLDVETSTLTVGIRGTMIVLSEQRKEDLTIAKLSVLSGVTQVTYIDEGGARQSFQLPSGSTALLTDKNGNGHADALPIIRKTEKQDVEGFVDQQLRKNPEMLKRIENENSRPDDMNVESGQEGDYPYSAGGKWQWNGKVSLVARSASKMYDGTPLIRASDVLVEGLPSEFRCSVSATGALTDAGKIANPVGDYRIYNSRNEDVTSHFTNVDKIDGQLIVEPVPITVWTGSEEKVYDGTPLTNEEAGVVIRRSVDAQIGPEAEIETAAGGTGGVAVAQAAATRNVSYLVDPSLKNQTLYGVCGVVAVHAMNPLTGQASDVQLKAGYRLIIYLNDEEGRESLKYETEPVALDDLPEEMLRIYADNPDALEQACQETGWKEEDVKARIARLNLQQNTSAKMVEQNGIRIVEDEADRLLTDFTNVHINIDSSITNYNGRALNGQEAKFVTPPIDGEISVTATGSQTDAGESKNTYEIDWGTARKENYVVTEELGTLTVTPATVTVTTGSAEKVYDGQPLTNSEAAIRGLVKGERATIIAKGSITRAGKAVNTYTINWGTAKQDNYTVSEHLGSLTVEPLQLSVDFYGDEAELVDGNLTMPNPVLSYGNGPHAGDTVAAVRTRSLNMAYRFTLFTGDQIGLEISSKKKGGGYYDIIATPTYPSGLQSSFSIGFSGTVYEGGPQELTIITPSASKTYDGTPLTGTDVTVEGLDEDDTILVTVTGSQTDAGSSTNTYTIDWGDTNAEDYTIVEELGTLTVEKVAVAITTGTDSKTYDGTPLTKDELYVNGTLLTKEGTGYKYSLIGTDYITASVTGTVTDATAEPADNTCVWAMGSGNAGNYEVTVTPGTLTVSKYPVKITTGSATKEFDGEPLSSDVVKVNDVSLSPDETGYKSSLAGGDVLTVYPMEQTDATAEAVANACTYALDTANTGNYEITEDFGTLHVTQRIITLKLDGLNQNIVYDGAYHGDGLTAEAEGITVTCSARGDGCWDVTMPWEDVLDVEVSGGETDAGDYELSCTWEASSGDIENYSISAVGKNLTIKPAGLAIVSDSAEKEYDGTPLTCFVLSSNYTCVQEEEESPVFTVTLEGEETITVTVTGSQTDKGGSKNTFDIAWGAVNQNNYRTTTSYGDLNVTANHTYITITAPSDSKTYDGWPLDAPTDWPWANGLPAGLELEAEKDYNVTQTDVGTAPVAVTSYKFLNGTADVTSYFDNVELVSGTLTVNPIQLTLTAESDEMYYCGVAYSREASFGGDFAEDEGADVYITCDKTGVGEWDLSYEIEWYENTDSRNYHITATLGKLKILPIKVRVYVSGSYQYDGNLHDGANNVEAYVEEGGPEYTITAERTGASTWRLKVQELDETFTLTATGGGTEAGTYPLTCSVSGASSSHYDVTIDSSEGVFIGQLTD